MNTFRGVFVEVLCYKFNFVNMRFVVKVIFFGTYFSLLILQEDLFPWKVANKILLFPLLLSHMFPWMNKFLFTENNFLPRLIKEESILSKKVSKCLCLEYA